MQIRAQLRRYAVAFSKFPEEFVRQCCYNMTCPSGYHGIHVRVRFKSRARHHGTKTGQSKKAHK